MVGEETKGALRAAKNTGLIRRRTCGSPLDLEKIRTVAVVSREARIFHFNDNSFFATIDTLRVIYG